MYRNSYTVHHSRRATYPTSTDNDIQTRLELPQLNWKHDNVMLSDSVNYQHQQLHRYVQLVRAADRAAFAWR